jgi:maltooligosyltrehalose synthase
MRALAWRPSPRCRKHGPTPGRAGARVVGPSLSVVDGGEAPDQNDQYFLLQALLGAWPLELLERDDETAVTAFRERTEGFLTKALREAKRHSELGSRQ